MVQLDTSTTAIRVCVFVYKFTGKERDAESGLDYFGARYYGSNMGRFMSPDWADKPEAVPYSSLSDPQTLNLYGYMRNNPLGGADVDGHSGYDEFDLLQNSIDDQKTQQQNQAQQKIGQDPTLPTEVAPPPLSIADRITDALMPKSYEDLVSMALMIPTDGASEEVAALSRAMELSSAMGKTADYVTVAVTETKEGTKVVSSSENALRPAVRSLLKGGEVAAKGAGHAEVTGVNAAKQMGLTPTGVAASRAICPSCANYLRAAGVAALSVLKGLW